MRISKLAIGEDREGGGLMESSGVMSEHRRCMLVFALYLGIVGRLRVEGGKIARPFAVPFSTKQVRVA